MARETLHGRANLPQLPRARRRGLAHDTGDFFREGGGEARDGPGGSGREAVREQRFRADERRRGLRRGRAGPSRTASPRPSGRRDRSGLAEALHDFERDRVTARRLELVEIERRRSARCGGGRKCSKSASPSSRKYGGPMTATASAPAAAACSASATVSAVVCAPQCTATWSRPRAAARQSSVTRRRSSTEKRTPSPVVPMASTPSRPPSARNERYGSNACSSRDGPPSRRGVSAAASAPWITGRT